MNTVPLHAPESGLMTVKDAAAILAVSPFTLYDKIRHGTDGLGGRYICGRPRVLRSAVLAAAGEVAA